MAYDKSGGILFKIKSDHPKAPLYEGNIEIKKDDLRELIALAQNGKEAKMRLVTFRAEGRKGPFMSLALSSWAAHEKEIADFKAKQSGGAANDGDFNDGMGGSSDPWDL